MRSHHRFGIPAIAGTALALGLAVGAGADTAADKAGRGLAAMTTGFLELPGNMVVETREHGAGYGMTVGFVKGLGGIVVRELVGVYEFVSAPFAVPEGYRPILSPEYPWGYFEEGRTSTAAHDPGAPVVATGDEEL